MYRSRCEKVKLKSTVPDSGLSPTNTMQMALLTVRTAPIYWKRFFNCNRNSIICALCGFFVTMQRPCRS